MKSQTVSSALGKKAKKIVKISKTTFAFYSQDLKATREKDMKEIKM